jgi:Fe2+ transport system protein FeoA
MISLIDAPQGKQLKIVEFEGGQSIHRRLMALGFYKNDTIELDSKSIFGGPLLIRDLTTEVSAALGRGIARKIMVEIIDEK